MKKTSLLLFVIHCWYAGIGLVGFSVINGTEHPLQARCTYGTNSNATKSSTLIPKNKSATIKCSYFKGSGLMADDEKNRIYTLDLVIDKQVEIRINLHNYTIDQLDSDAIAFFIYPNDKFFVYPSAERPHIVSSPRFRVKMQRKVQEKSPSLPSVEENKTFAEDEENKQQEEMTRVLSETWGPGSPSADDILRDLKESSLSL